MKVMCPICGTTLDIKEVSELFKGCPVCGYKKFIFIGLKEKDERNIKSVEDLAIIEVIKNGVYKINLEDSLLRMLTNKDRTIKPIVIGRKGIYKIVFLNNNDEHV